MSCQHPNRKTETIKFAALGMANDPNASVVTFERCLDCDESIWPKREPVVDNTPAGKRYRTASGVSVYEAGTGEKTGSISGSIHSYSMFYANGKEEWRAMYARSWSSFTIHESCVPLDTARKIRAAVGSPEPDNASLLHPEVYVYKDDDESVVCRIAKQRVVYQCEVKKATGQERYTITDRHLDNFNEITKWDKYPDVVKRKILAACRYQIDGKTPGKVAADESAYPERLPDGTWGVRIPGGAKPGDEVVVVSRRGRTWQAIVDAIIDADTDSVLARMRPEKDDRTASPYKLPDGTWGAKVRNNPSVDDTITITARSGKSWEATITDVVSAIGEFSICRIAY